MLAGRVQGVVVQMGMATSPLKSLPQSRASELPSQTQPITVAVTPEGAIYVNETQVGEAELIAQVSALATPEDRIFLRGDTSANYGAVMRVMGMLSAAGYPETWEIEFAPSSTVSLEADVKGIVGNVAGLNPVKVEDLATRQDGRQNLVLLGSSQNKNGVGGRFFQRFQEGVESRLRQHVNLVNDVYFIISRLGRIANLIDQIPDVFHGVIGSRIQFVDIK